MEYIDLQLQIDTLKEYIDTEICKKCDEMKSRLDDLKNKLLELDTSSKGLDKNDS